MTRTCGCGHPHLPGATYCYVCGLPTIVPPAVAAVTPEQPAAPTPPAPAAGGTQFVREVGRLQDMDGDTVRLEVNYDAVVIRIGSRDGDSVHLTSTLAENFGQLYIAACWQAAENRAQMAEQDRAPT